jgi:selenocysteine-specific elongation factor
MKHLILGTAGHIDHGKTTLIQKLTGRNTDRLNEEQDRGISIDLGFASLVLDDEVELGIIDVPGHEKFVKNMLAGAGGVDLALLVVAGDEGVMPQTLEHLNILELLGVELGVVAITKVDLVEKEWLELVKEDIKEKLEGTFMETAPLVPVSGVTGEGIDLLKDQLKEISDQLEFKGENENLYLPIDRVFSVDGFGTVITGTLMAGELERGERVVISPQKKEVEVRDIQVHNDSVDKAVAGQRTGVNLNGVEVDEISRGDILAEPGSLEPATLMDAKLELLSGAPLSLQHNDRVRIHLGAKEVFGRISILDSEEIYPGGAAYVQLRLEESIVAYYDQRFVIRRYSPMTTIGGGKIINPDPNKHRRFEKETISKLKIKENGTVFDRIKLSVKDFKRTVLAKDLMVETGLPVKEIKVKCKELAKKDELIKFDAGQNISYLHDDDYSLLKGEVSSSLEDYHHNYHLRWGRSKEEIRSQLEIELNKQEYDQLLDNLLAEGVIEIQGAEVKLAKHQIELSEDEQKVRDMIEDKFKEKAFMPPTLKNLKEDLEVNSGLITEIFNLLVRKDILKRVDAEIYFHHQVLSEAEDKLKNFLQSNDEITLGEYRDLIDSSRKYTLPLLNYFDQQGITKRVGDNRVLAE